MRTSGIATVSIAQILHDLTDFYKRIMFNEGNRSVMVLDNLDVPYSNNHVFLRATFSQSW